MRAAYAASRHRRRALAVLRRHRRAPRGRAFRHRPRRRRPPSPSSPSPAAPRCWCRCPARSTTIRAPTRARSRRGRALVDAAGRVRRAASAGRAARCAARRPATLLDARRRSALAQHAHPGRGRRGWPTWSSRRRTTAHGEHAHEGAAARPSAPSTSSASAASACPASPRCCTRSATRCRAATSPTAPTCAACARPASRSPSATTRRNVGDAQVVVVSTAVKRDNPEVAAARAPADPGRAPGRDAGRADAAEMVDRGRRHARQDHDHQPDRRGAGGGASSIRP